MYTIMLGSLKEPTHVCYESLLVALIACCYRLNECCELQNSQSSIHYLCIVWHAPPDLGRHFASLADLHSASKMFQCATCYACGDSLLVQANPQIAM